ncbi:MAG: type IV secretion system DNA-binding domain-containing protein [Candidatus Zambryskibacteria bacterium]|nr:type IV secretion system DNA-binding domain-containing protein [Candidatus Zambryskibacteria bacterium]
MPEDPNKVTYFAETDSRHDHKKFGIKSADRSKHIYVIGKTGMGKSTLLENMAIQDIQSGNGIAFIDPHGGTAEKLLEYVPEERIKDVIYFAPFDMDYPVAFNIMEDVGATKRHLVVNGLMSVFEKIWEDAWSARMAYILQNTLLALLEYPDATLLAVNRMYTDKEFRNKVVENVTDISVKSFWVDEYAKYTDKYAQEATPAIQNKVGQFAGNPLIRNIIGQSKSSFDLRKVMDEKKIMIVNLSKGRVGEGNAHLLGSMLITKLYLAAMSRADESAISLSKLPQFYLFVDEFQSFADKSFAEILSEARKYKLNLTMAHQYIEQMEEEVRDAVFGNVGTMITFRVGAYDAEVLEKEFAPTFTAEDLVNLGLRQIYLKLMIDSVTSQPFSATTLPPIAVPAVSYVEEILANSRRTYARPKSVVEKAITDWHGSTTDTRNIIAAKPKPIVPPPPKISLESLKNKNNNQRKPDVKNVSALRDALKSVMGNQPKENAQAPMPNVQPILPSQGGSNPKPQSPKPQNGPSPEELKKLLGVE